MIKYRLSPSNLRKFLKQLAATVNSYEVNYILINNHILLILDLFLEFLLFWQFHYVKSFLISVEKS